MGQKILSISPFSPPSFPLKWDFGGDGVPVRLRSRPKASISLSPYTVTALLITRHRKEKWMTGPRIMPPAPLPCFQPLDCELNQPPSLPSLLSPSLRRRNRRCWMMDRCSGIVLFCSALKEIIDLHYGSAPKTQTPPSTSRCSTPITAPPPTWQPAPNQRTSVYLTSCLLWGWGVISSLW